MNIIKKYKWILTALAFAMLLNLGPWARAFEPPQWSIPSTQQTADASIVSGTGYFYGIMIDASGVTATTTFEVYDSGTTVTANRILPSFDVKAGVSLPLVEMMPIPIGYDSGIYVDVTTTGTCPKYMIFYRTK